MVYHSPKCNKDGCDIMREKKQNYLLSGATLCRADGAFPSDILIVDGLIAEISPNIPHRQDVTQLQLNDFHIFPGFVDVHVHLREPGFLYKETIHTGTEAAARGGFTAVCAMPNLNPCPDNLRNLQTQLDLINKYAKVDVKPFGTITKGQKGEKLADFAELSPLVAAFSDDGYGIQEETLMESAMLSAKKHGKIIAAHCEDNSLLNGGYIHDGTYARKHSHRGISSESEWRQVKRDLDLAAKTGAAYHICHISTKESVKLLREAKAAGLDVSAEVSPHHLLLCDEDISEDGRFKMNPPLRSKADKDALVSALLDGVIDMIATDHAPHSAEEKSFGLKGSAMGVAGLETAFQVLYTNLVLSGYCSLEKLIMWLHKAPLERFGIGHALAVGQPANLTVFDLKQNYTINPDDFLSKGKSTPFANHDVKSVCKLTVVNGNPVFNALK